MPKILKVDVVDQLPMFLLDILKEMNMLQYSTSIFLRNNGNINIKKHPNNDAWKVIFQI